ncbi:hypothetical protein OSTOST_16471 [Ostertagia ostertagi]
MPRSEAPEPVLQTAKPLPPSTPSKEVDQKATSRSKEQTEEKQKVEKQEFLPYPSVRSPTKSAKRRRELELQEEKKRKIAEGFYQPRSDEDDTLEKVSSLKMEQTEKTKSLVSGVASKRNSSRRRFISQKTVPKVHPTQD